MKKYLLIILLIGFCSGQDGFFSKFKSKYPKLYCSECELTMKQTIGGFVCVDGHTRIEKSAFLKDDGLIEQEDYDANKKELLGL